MHGPTRAPGTCKAGGVHTCMGSAAVLMMPACIYVCACYGMCLCMCMYEVGAVDDAREDHSVNERLCCHLTRSPARKRLTHRESPCPAELCHVTRPPAGWPGTSYAAWRYGTLPCHVLFYCSAMSRLACLLQLLQPHGVDSAREG